LYCRAVETELQLIEDRIADEKRSIRKRKNGISGMRRRMRLRGTERGYM
jgi:hypothetical protein